MTRRAEFIAKWRDSHKEVGWHDAECCVNELLDELEALFIEEMQDAKCKPAAAHASCSVLNCKNEASFIINKIAACYAHKECVQHGR